MSIVDPLATLEWEVSRLLRSAPEKERNSLQSTVLRGNLYVTVSHKPLRHYEQVGTLFRISADDLSSWEQLPPLPSAFSGLATYRSHLVLVGGVDLKYQDEPTMATNKVWCSPDGVQPWQSLSIPPMPKTEYCPAVASVGSGGGTPVVEAAAGVVASVGSGGTPAEAAAGVVASVGSGGTLAEAAAGVVASVGSGGTPAAVGVVASVGSGGTLVAAECLIVVGEDEDTWLSSVTVFRGQQWVRLRGFLAEGLSSDVTCTCLNGNLYIAASCTAGYEPESYSSIFWCSVRELVKECEKRELAAKEGEEEEEEEEEEREASKSLWHRFALPGRSGGRSDVVLYDLVSLGGEHLVVTCRNLRGNGSIHAFSALTQTWAKVGSLFDDGSGAASVDMTVAVSSQGELLVARDRRDLTIFKGSLHVPPYYPDKKMDMSSLSRVEAAGIQVMQPIAEQLVSLGLAPQPLAAEGEAYTPTALNHESLVSKLLVDRKLATWKALFEYMHDTLSLEEVALQIEDYISCVRSLKELCVSGVMSALLKRQETLEPDQLQGQLPEYLSPMLRRALVNRYRAITRHS